MNKILHDFGEYTTHQKNPQTVVMAYNSHKKSNNVHIKIFLRDLKIQIENKEFSKVG